MCLIDVPLPAIRYQAMGLTGLLITIALNPV